MSMKIMVVVASTRPGRLGPAIAEWFVRATAATAAELEVVIDVADLAEVGLPFLDEPEHPSTGIYVHAHSRAWSSRVDAADAFVFVTSEYNFAMPATLKNAFDFLSREWAWKPCLFVGYGNTSAGSRAVQMARGVAASMRMLSVGGDVYLRIADDVVDGEVVADERRAGYVQGGLTQLVQAAGALRPLREQDGRIVAADAGDVSELVVLQRACWVDEAIANQALDLPALTETSAQLEAALVDWQVWVVRAGGRLIASVRARRDGDAWLIGRLMVAPDYRHQGLGQRLLAHAEAHAPAGTATIALCTGVRSTGPQALYRQAGYALTREGAPAGSVLLRKAAAGNASVAGG